MFLHRSDDRLQPELQGAGPDCRHDAVHKRRLRYDHLLPRRSRSRAAAWSTLAPSRRPRRSRRPGRPTLVATVSGPGEAGSGGLEVQGHGCETACKPIGRGRANLFPMPGAGANDRKPHENPRPDPPGPGGRRQPDRGVASAAQAADVGGDWSVDGTVQSRGSRSRGQCGAGLACSSWRAIRSAWNLQEPQFRRSHHRNHGGRRRVTRQWAATPSSDPTSTTQISFHGVLGRDGVIGGAHDPCRPCPI